MDCAVCRNLEGAYKAALGEYVEARSSAGYRVTTMLAGQKNVEMERARYELEEHRSMCVSAVLTPSPLPKRDMPVELRRLAA